MQLESRFDDLLMSLLLNDHSLVSDPAVLIQLEVEQGPESVGEFCLAKSVADGGDGIISFLGEELRELDVSTVGINEGECLEDGGHEEAKTFEESFFVLGKVLVPVRELARDGFGLNFSCNRRIAHAGKVAGNSCERILSLDCGERAGLEGEASLRTLLPFPQ